MDVTVVGYVGKWRIEREASGYLALARSDNPLGHRAWNLRWEDGELAGAIRGSILSTEEYEHAKLLVEMFAPLPDGRAWSTAEEDEWMATYKPGRRRSKEKT